MTARRAILHGPRPNVTVLSRKKSRTHRCSLTPISHVSRSNATPWACTASHVLSRLVQRAVAAYAEAAYSSGVKPVKAVKSSTIGKCLVEFTASDVASHLMKASVRPISSCTLGSCPTMERTSVGSRSRASLYGGVVVISAASSELALRHARVKTSGKSSSPQSPSDISTNASRRTARKHSRVYTSALISWRKARMSAGP
jgi:hypothetical protein